MYKERGTNFFNFKMLNVSFAIRVNEDFSYIWHLQDFLGFAKMNKQYTLMSNSKGLDKRHSSNGHRIIPL